MKNRNASPRARRHKVEIIITLCVVVLLILVMVGSVTPLRNVITSPPPARTPTPTVLPGDDLFYIQVTPNWGTVTVDGHLLSQLPLVDSGPPLRLSIGRHTIIWHAEPFPPIPCIVSVPSLLAQEPCPYESHAPNSNARLISFTASLANLSASQQTALFQQSQSALDALDSSDMVQPGEKYLYAQPSSSISMHTATEPLRATLRFHLDTDPSSQRVCSQNGGTCIGVNGEDCHHFCTIPTPMPLQLASETFWDVIAMVYATWTYQTGSGQLVAQNQPDSSTSITGTEYGITLSLRWDNNAWHVSVDKLTEESFEPSFDVFSTNDPICTPIQEQIAGNQQDRIAQGPFKTVLNWSFFASSNRATGCLAVAVPQQDTSYPPQYPVGYYFYRFGIFLTVNATAQQYLPGLPAADAYEQSIAQRLITAYQQDIQMVS